MENSLEQNAPGATPPAVTPPVTPPAQPPEAPGATPPAAAAPSAPSGSGTPPAPRDPLANSSWPDSAKDRVRDLSRKNRETSEKLAQSQAYINKLEEDQKNLKFPTRDKFEAGENGDVAFVSALTAHNANLAALAVEKGRTTGEVERTKQDLQTSHAELVQEKVEQARKEFPDWDQVVNTSKIPLGQHLSYALTQAQRGPQMAYILNKLPPQEVARLNSMTWTDILQEFPGLETRFRSGQRPPAPPAPPAPPIEPIGAGGVPPSSSAYKEWETRRNKESRVVF